MARTGEAIIEIRGLWTILGGFVIHKNLDMVVDRGEILAVVGGSGTGKTTLLRQMIGLETPSRGSVKIFGEELDSNDPARVAQIRARWGMLFQQGALFSALSVLDNIALP